MSLRGKGAGQLNGIRLRVERASRPAIKEQSRPLFRVGLYYGLTISRPVIIEL